MAEIIKVNQRHPDPQAIARAAEMIRRGEVIAIPTETFYGLAANPFSAEAVERVFEIKGRPKDMPLLLLVDSVEMARGLAADLPAGFERLTKQFWPGPLTIVVEANANVPPSVTGGTGRIGLRLPSAAIAVAIVKKAGVPITGTSANRSGETECSTAEEVEQRIGSAVPLIIDSADSAHGLDDPAEDGERVAIRPSTVIDLREDLWEMLREGAIRAQEIAAVLGAPRRK